MAENMNRQNRLYSPASYIVIQPVTTMLTAMLDEFPKLRRIHLPVHWLGVNKHWPCSHVPNSVRRRDKTERWHQYFVDRRTAGHQHRHMQCGRAIYGGYRVLSSHVPRNS